MKKPTASYTDICDAVIADLVQNVEGLAELPEERIHRYAPWNPENFSALANERHLGVWIVTDTPVPYASLTSEITEEIAVCVWEDASLESGRRMAEVDKAREFLDLAEHIRDRFFLVENQRLGGSVLTQYGGTEFVGEPGSIRWFRVAVRMTYHQPIL